MVAILLFPWNSTVVRPCTVNRIIVIVVVRPIDALDELAIVPVNETRELYPAWDLDNHFETPAHSSNLTDISTI
jgi:hypothetical protein